MNAQLRNMKRKVNTNRRKVDKNTSHAEQINSIGELDTNVNGNDNQASA